MKRAKPPGQTLVPTEVLPPAFRSTFETRRASARSLVARAVGVKALSTQDETDAANSLMLDVKSLWREIDASFHSIVDPLDLARKNAETLFNPVLRALLEAETKLKRLIGQRALEEKLRVDREKREAEEKLLAVQRQIDDARKKAAETGKPLPPAPKLSAKEVAPAQTTHSSLSGRSHVGFEWDYEVENVDALNAAFPELVEKTPRRRMLLDKLKVTNGAPVPGLRIFQRPKVTGVV